MHNRFRYHCLMFTLLASCVCVCDAGPAAENWPQWRGPNGDGHYAGKLPTKWDDSQVIWKAELAGSGHSSPIVWGDRIYLTGALEDGRQRVVTCLDRSLGKTVWSRVAWSGEAEQTHKMNQWASATCATDGERIVAFFGRGGLHCFTMDGELIWTRSLGDFQNPWGVASSPLIIDDLVVQNCEAENESYLLAVDKRTGATKWRTPRAKQRGWSTPLLVKTAERREIVINGEQGMNAYDVETGKHLWFCKGDRGRGTPTVVGSGELVIAVSGRPGDMFASRTGGSGVVNDSHEAWRTKRRGGRDLGSPIVVGEYLCVFGFRPGVATCYEAATGNETAVKRLTGVFCASPIAADGLLYVPNEAGEVFVLRPGRALEVVSRNQITVGDDEIFRASLAAADGRLYLRSDRALYCIGR